MNEDGQEFYLLDMHFDNPKLVAGVHYETGVELFTTSKLREHEGGVATVAHAINPSNLIPPNVTNFVIAGHCSSACTSEKISVGQFKLI